MKECKKESDEVNYRPRPTQPLLFTNSPPSHPENLAGCLSLSCLVIANEHSRTVLPYSLKAIGDGMFLASSMAA